MVEITLIAKPGCHLCEEARPIVERVVAGFEGATLTEVSILDDPTLEARWADDIPVVLIDGRPHSSWRVDPAKLADRIQARLTA
ncbi:glutaredoxin family protein [Agrococcus sp. ARC_14]|uniref:glutaredoxin family protein n=1 Tax=Agrococcus sp. ARC_14 TaxID=2919927 RepID=UPI001F05EEC6|nr:glutaredoxin family protein [Agrococcus sp. ARC_14]MCH1882111.1 glutaredoxin family protein [Agrococcus sp. ARC_14]